MRQTPRSTDAKLSVGTSENNSAAGGLTLAEPALDATDPPFVIAVLSDPAAGGRSVGGTPGFASAPSGKAFTGQIALYADATGAGSCTFYGHLALQG